MGACASPVRPAHSRTARLENKSMITIIILAAGASRRMGFPKQLLQLDGKPLVWRVANEACHSAADQVLVVTGAYANEVENALCGLPIKTVYNARWDEGQAESVKAGVAAVKKDSSAVIFLPADQPFVTAELLNSLIQVYKTGPASIVAPVFHNCRGTPVLFDLKWRKELLSLAGDCGARKLLNDFPFEVDYIAVDEECLLLDADTPEEYEVLKKLWEARKDGASEQTKN